MDSVIRYIISENRTTEAGIDYFTNNLQSPRFAHAQKKDGFSQVPTAQAQHFACLLWHCHRFATVILFALFFANAPQHIAILVPAVAKSCPNLKKTKQKDTALQPPPPFRLCQYANRRKLSYIMWHYSTFPHAYRRLCQRRNVL